MDDGGRTNDRFSCLTDDAARPLRLPTITGVAEADPQFSRRAGRSA